ncbi:MAG: FKBP-type peptidyl-prolyl cis-trans isomerase [Balneolaceae bacterium]|nr:FKBP-type peptidyl-prolyl cis-trans isomerase [Balneolaceae bacterium]
MRFSQLILTIPIILFATFACTQSDSGLTKEVQLYSLVDSASYAIGFQNGNRLSSQGFPNVAFNAYVAGFMNGVDGDENQIPEAEMRAMFQRFNQFIQDKIKNENRLEAEEFFAENRNKEGVRETASGLQYKVIKEGDGLKPLPQNTVVVMYEGRLIDGTIFDSNYGSGEPAELVLGQMIPGWIEGIQLMNVGSEYEFYIPSDLAYGENPRPGGPIMPNDALIFKVELLDIK